MPDDKATFRLIYLSHNLIPAGDRRAVLGDVFSVARSTNKKLGVTGALLITDDSFVQVLEGEEPVVRALYERISLDHRHDRVTVIQNGAVPGRVFGRWSMAKVSADGEPDIPLLTNVDKGGISPAAGHPTTPEQDALLNFMRDSITGSISR